MKRIKEINNFKIAVHIVIYVILLFSIIIILNSISGTKDAYKYTDISAHSTIRINDTEYKDIDLNTYSFSPVSKGDLVVVTSIMPDVNYPDAMLRILVYQSAITVYLDEEKLYSYGHTEYNNDDVVGSGYHYIPLPNKYIGKTLRIELTPAETAAFGSVDNIVLDSATDLTEGFLIDNRFFIFVCLFLIVLGFALISTTLPLLLINKRFTNLLYVGILVFFCGLWYTGSSKILQLFSHDFALNQFCEYFSLYMIPIPFLLIIYEFRSNSRINKHITKVLLGIIIAFNVIVWGAYLIGGFHYSKVLIVIHIILLIDILYAILSFLISIKSSSAREQIIMLGVLLALLFCGSHLVIYNLDKYFEIHMSFDVQAATVIGILLLVIGMIISGCMDLAGMAYEAAEADFLADMAFTDYLTKLANLAKCQSFIDSLKESNTSFTIISFDIDNLKTTNDTLGHKYGDELLKAFSKLLSSNFSNQGLLGRVGGDEFIAILPGIKKELILNLLKDFEKDINDYNSIYGDNFCINVSYGYADTSETPADYKLSSLQELADKRMYEMKSIHKKNNKDTEE